MLASAPRLAPGMMRTAQHASYCRAAAAVHVSASTSRHPLDDDYAMFRVARALRLAELRCSPRPPARSASGTTRGTVAYEAAVYTSFSHALGGGCVRARVRAANAWQHASVGVAGVRSDTRRPSGVHTACERAGAHTPEVCVLFACTKDHGPPKCETPYRRHPRT